MCKEDEDIESFLHNRAIEFEKISKARTYLIVDADKLMAENSEFVICGYVSLALKILTISEHESNRIRKKLDGFNAKMHGIPIQEFPVYLIGQLARDSRYTYSDLSGSELLQCAIDVIASAVSAVGGRYAMIECHNEPKLITFYENNGFKTLTKVPDQDMPMVQMIKGVY